MCKSALPARERRSRSQPPLHARPGATTGEDTRRERTETPGNTNLFAVAVAVVAWASAGHCAASAQPTWIKHAVGEPPYYRAATGAVQIADVDGDGHPDVLTTVRDTDNPDNGIIYWWENRGDRTFNRHTVVQDFGRPDDLRAIDMDGDSDIDFVVTVTFPSSA
ncbi:MAG: hypothetical protein CL908_23495 [Deltaproteobacteria bacterium]|nr:hypothetical protein [Deltaproteobacteria bacterium]